jgi:small-conductance mechanosensitive channel
MLELQRVSEAGIILVNAAAALVVVLLVIFFLWENRVVVARIICTEASERVDRKTLLRVQLAEYWHLLAIPYLLALWGVWVLYLLVGRADLVLPILALMLSIPLYILLDWIGQAALDTTLGPVHKPEAAADEECEFDAEDQVEIPQAKDKETGKESAQVERFAPILRRCLSFSIAGIVFFWLLRLWGFDVRIGKAITQAAFKIIVVIMVSYVIWKLAENAINRRLEKIEHLKPDDEAEEMGGAGGSRIGTLLKLFRKFLLFTLVTMVGMIILSAIGVNIGPLLAGAGIVGLAIGFGSQTLVKDIVSGVFFLIDVAFRLGDYVEAGSVKGTVENISIRSLRLRHPRGMVYTVPYSDLGSISNYSRDYIIMKIEFRVPYGTDINKVKKIIKKINDKVEQDEELGPKLLAPIKSQGVKELDDSGMIMRIKFKTKPGDQFGIRREIFSRLQTAFEKSGIQFAHRQVIVQLPQEKTTPPTAAGESGDAASADRSKQVLSAGAAAAIAAAMAEEEQLRKESDKKSD